MDAVVDFGQFAFGTPAELFLFLFFQPLELFDDIQLEFYGNPARKFERNILMSIGSSVTPRFGNDTDGIGRIDPLLRRQGKGIQSGLLSKPLEFEGFRKEAGLNAFTLSPQKWINTTNAIGIISKSGRYGGTYAHKDIAFKFASWISVEFELYIVKEFQRLKEEEQKQLGWSAKRELSKINYRIHTDAIKQNLIPAEVTAKQASIIYANEADVLNGAMFGMTAKTWREQNPDLKGNIRDYATINELICLSNMENLNAVFIDQKMPQGERLVKLNRIAIQQMQVLESNDERKLLK